MDQQRFDNWTRTLVSGMRTRRGALRLAVVAAAGLGAATALPGDVLACRKDGRSCKRSGQCCSGQCRKGRKGKRKCKPAPGALGCTVKQDTCRFPVDAGLIPCPANPEGICVRLDNGRPFCIRGVACVECESDGECTVLAGGVPGHCVTSCQKCPESGGRMCVYPRLVNVP